MDCCCIENRKSKTIALVVKFNLQFTDMRQLEVKTEADLNVTVTVTYPQLQVQLTVYKCSRLFSDRTR